MVRRCPTPRASDTVAGELHISGIYPA